MAYTTRSDRELHDSLMIESLVELESTENTQYYKDTVYKTYDVNREEMVIKTVSGFGQAPKVAERAALQTDDIRTPFKLTVEMEKRGYMFEWSKEATETDKLNQMAERAPRIERSFTKTKNIVMANKWNYAFSSNSDYFGADGKALCATDHPLDAGQSGTNRPATDVAFDPLALQELMTLAARTKDHRNVADPINGNWILQVPPDLQWVAEEAVYSDKRAKTAVNDKNVVRQRIADVRVQPYITSTTAWFLQQANPKDQGIFMWSIRPFTSYVWFNGMHDCFSAANTERYVVGHDEWRGIVGTDGTP